MNFYVYMILTKIKDKHISYVGYTKNLKKNALHCIIHQKVQNLQKGKKWKIIYSKRYKTKSNAMRNEYLLKKDLRKKEIK